MHPEAEKRQKELFTIFAKIFNCVTITSLTEQMFFIFCAVRNIKNNSMKKFKLLISGLFLMMGGGNLRSELGDSSGRRFRLREE